MASVLPEAHEPETSLPTSSSSSLLGLSLANELTTLDRRRVRTELNAIRALTATLPTKVASFVDDSELLSSVGDFLMISTEWMTVFSYFVFSQQIDCHVTRQTIDITHTPFPWKGVRFNGVMSLVFLFHYFWHLFLASNRQSFARSVYSFISILTTVTMALSFLLALDEDSPTSDVDTASTVWAPAFLRVWWAHRQTSHMLSKYHKALHPAIKEMVILGSFVFSLIVTSTGCQQFFDAWGTFCTKDLINEFYLIMVTVTTLGFGDSVPISTGGRITIVLVIFTAMFFLPVALGKIGSLASYLSSQNTYSHMARHVVICGHFGLLDLKVLVGEFLFDSNKRNMSAQVNVVLVTENPLDERTLRWLNQPSLRNRVTVCVSDALRKGQIRRYKARAAEAIVLLSSRTAVAQRGDYETMMKSIVFHRYEPGVPQVLLLKRGMHVDAMRRTANVIMERERLKYLLMGIAVRLPLFIPFIVNLLKSSDPPAAVSLDNNNGVPFMHPSPQRQRQRPPTEQVNHRQHHEPHFHRHRPSFDGTATTDVSSARSDDDSEESSSFPYDQLPEGAFLDGTYDNWWKLYLEGASCNLHIVATPPTLHARLFSAAVIILQVKMCVTPIAILRRGKETTDPDEVMMCALREKLLPSDRLIVIGPCTLDATNFVSEFMKSHLGNVKLSSAAASQKKPKPGRDGGTASNEAPRMMQGTLSMHSLTATDQSGSRPTSPRKISSKRAFSYPFRDHVLLVDLSSSGASTSSEYNLNAEESIECEQFQALDIVRLLRHVIQQGLAEEEKIPVVLLSGQSMSRRLSESWPEINRPIYHVRGYGTERTHLRTVGVAEARAVVLFFGAECERQDATIHLVADVVFELLAAVGREKEVPIIVEVDDLTLGYLAPPRMCAMSSEALHERSRANYSYSPSFISGKIIASTMVDAIVFQALRNPAIPKILACMMGVSLEDDGDILKKLKRVGAASPEATRLRARHRRQRGEAINIDGDGATKRSARSSTGASMASRISAVMEDLARPSALAASHGMFKQDTVFCASIERFMPPFMLPNEIAALNYGELLSFAVKTGCILLGLRRCVNTKDLGNHIVGTPYFATNPPPSTQLYANDHVYFLFVDECGSGGE
ncbi:calcium/potassium channel protein, putative [Bodo saltans]|uniref:Calcium/potassium channel protein, putative n=1 Tax=Bodo saltans TaxID=75058 RepID=A0A0S4J7R3_BODSA|nr:calcium/potassium channel protein, putative [Bodo saltans]|eukprot:CUG87465.1 calcium/potassium channel protein, putative [Bodo saltans]